jgi:hypothetical protein
MDGVELARLGLRQMHHARRQHFETLRLEVRDDRARFSGTKGVWFDDRECVIASHL